MSWWGAIFKAEGLMQALWHSYCCRSLVHMNSFLLWICTLLSARLAVPLSACRHAMAKPGIVLHHTVIPCLQGHAPESMLKYWWIALGITSKG
jgi:hypothetical protein